MHFESSFVSAGCYVLLGFYLTLIAWRATIIASLFKKGILDTTCYVVDIAPPVVTKLRDAIYAKLWMKWSMIQDLQIHLPWYLAWLWKAWWYAEWASKIRLARGLSILNVCKVKLVTAFLHPLSFLMIKLLSIWFLTGRNIIETTDFTNMHFDPPDVDDAKY